MLDLLKFFYDVTTSGMPLEFAWLMLLGGVVAALTIGKGMR